MSNPITDLIGGFQDLVAQVPEFLHPIIVAAAGAVPFLEGEAAAAIGVIGGLHPLVALIAAVVGNFGCVVLVVLLSSRVRTFARARSSRRVNTTVHAPVRVTTSTVAVTPGLMEADEDVRSDIKPESKGRQKARRWLARFGLPGASVLAPLAIPTHFTAMMFVAAGFTRRRVLVWQAVAITFWTSIAVTVSTIGTLLYPVS